MKARRDDGGTEVEMRNVLQATRERFGTRRPTRAQLANFVAGLGIGEGLALASLMLAAWAYLFPRSADKSPRCPLRRPFTGRACGAELVHIEYREADRTLLMVCAHGHRTKKRTSGPRRGAH